MTVVVKLVVVMHIHVTFTAAMPINAYLLRPPTDRVLRRVVLTDRNILERRQVRVVNDETSEIVNA